MRQLCRMLDAGLLIVGVVVIVSAVLFVREIPAQVGIVMLGIFLIEAGVWKLANQLLPSQRTFNALRLEGDRFIGLIRQLNATALALKAYDSPANRETFADVREAMLQAVERMAHVAGKTNDELTDAQTVAARALTLSWSSR